MAITWHSHRYWVLSPEQRVLLNRYRTMRRCYELRLQGETEIGILDKTIEALRYLNDRIDALSESTNRPRGLRCMGEVW